MKICVFGDSIAWGAFDKEVGGWVERLKINLFDEHFVYNCSVSADSTEQILKRIKNEIKSRDSELIIFAVGINDAWFWNQKHNHNVTIKIFEKNILKLIKIAKKITNKVAFIGLTKVDEKLVTPISWSDKEISYYNEDIVMYDQTIKGLCQIKKIPYLSLYDQLDEKQDLTDGLHPNSQGHEKIYKRVKQFLKEKNLI